MTSFSMSPIGPSSGGSGGTSTPPTAEKLAASLMSLVPAHTELPTNAQYLPGAAADLYGITTGNWQPAGVSITFSSTADFVPATEELVLTVTAVTSGEQLVVTVPLKFGSMVTFNDILYQATAATQAWNADTHATFFSVDHTLGTRQLFIWALSSADGNYIDCTTNPVTVAIDEDGSSYRMWVDALPAREEHLGVQSVAKSLWGMTVDASLSDIYQMAQNALGSANTPMTAAKLKDGIVALSGLPDVPTNAPFQPDQFLEGYCITTGGWKPANVEVFLPKAASAPTFTTGPDGWSYGFGGNVPEDYWPLDIVLPGDTTYSVADLNGAFQTAVTDWNANCPATSDVNIITQWEIEFSEQESSALWRVWAKNCNGGYVDCAIASYSGTGEELFNDYVHVYVNNYLAKPADIRLTPVSASPAYKELLGIVQTLAARVTALESA